MSVRSGQSVTVEFTTSRFDTGAAADADSTPTGTLVVNGTDNGATVTVTNVDTGRYKAAVTLPTLAVGDVVELSVAATVNGVAGKGIVWRDTKDVLLDASGNTTFNNTTIATVTNLTNLPAVTTDWLTAAGVSAGAASKIAAAAEAAILDEGDATALLAAIAAKVEEFLINEGDATATLAAIAAAVRTNLATELGRIDVAVSTRASPDDLNIDGEGYPQVNAVKLGGTDVQELTDPIPASLDAVLGTALTEGAAGRLAAALKAFLDVAVPVLTTASVNQTADAPTAAAIADKILGRAVAGGSDGGRTVSAYLQGFANKVETSADGLTVTIYASDDTTVLQTLDATRLATSVGGLRSVTPE